MDMVQSDPAPRPDARGFVLVTLAALLAHATSLRGAFIWLDHAHISDGAALAQGRGWAALFTGGFAGTGFYRPLMAVSLSIDAALGGAAWLFHATSLAWHAAAAVMTMAAALALGLGQRAALLGGLIFAVHPATSLVAGAIAFRSEAMIAVAMLALVVFHRQGRTGPAALAVFAGALAKETAFGLAPLFIGALEFDAARNPDAPAWRTRGRLLFAEATAWFGALALRLVFAPPWRAEHVALSASETVGTRAAAFAKSALLLVAPWVRDVRDVCDSFAVTSLGSAGALAGLLLFLALIALALWRRGPALLLLLAFLPALQIVPVMRWWSPHYVYIPLAFAAMLAGQAVQRRAAGRPVQGALAVALLGLGGLTAVDDGRFASDHTLWTREVAAAPTCREGHFYLGEVARQQGALPAAAAHYAAAIAQHPGVLSYVDRSAALQNLGVTQLGLRNYAEARAAFTAAAAVVTDPNERRRLQHNLATVELQAGRPQEAVRLLQNEADRADALPESLLLQARALHGLGREAEAAALLARLRAAASRNR